MSGLAVKQELPWLVPLPERHFWLVVKAWHCKGHTVPQNFPTDLDSVPHVPVLFALVKGRSRWSALLHDYLYHTGHVSRAEADKLFLECMIEEGVPTGIAKSMYAAVRAWGWTRYGKSKRNAKRQKVLQRLVDEYGIHGTLTV